MSRHAHLASSTQHRWMVSYLDVLTILLIFFLSAAAKTWKNPPAQTNSDTTATSLTAAPSPASPADDVATTDTDPVLSDVEQQLEKEGLDVRPISNADNASNPAGARGLAIDLPQGVLFSAGDDRVRAEALPDLQKIAEALRGIPNKVNLAGHSDTTPIHNHRFRNNWELAAARSLRLMEVLTERYGIDESRVSISSYGALEPKSPNDTPVGRANNRRVEILIFQQP